MTPNKTPITYYGGKQLMLKHILPIIPEHKIYTEPFTGGAAVFFAKEPAPCEVINDLDKEVSNFYYTAKVNFNKLQQHVTTTLHSRNAYNDAKVVYTYPHLFDNVKRAWAFHTITAQSFSANMTSFATDRGGKTSFTINNKRLNFLEHIQQRLNHATIESDLAHKIVLRYDREDAFHYVDPPYFNSVMGPYKGYTESDFERDLNVLANVKGKFLLSSYPSELLTRFTNQHKWYQKEFTKAILVSNKVTKNKTEVLTANYPI